jgi:hypothetical protein
MSKITVKMNYTNALSACKAELCLAHCMLFYFVYLKYVHRIKTFVNQCLKSITEIVYTASHVR